MEDLRALLSVWLDPQFVGEIVLAWSGRLLAALAIFVIGRIVARALSAWLTRAVKRVGVDDTLCRFLGNLIYMVLLVFVVLTAISALGVPTTNFLAIVGAAGLAVGLALKDSLSNFSSGVMLVFFRPFKVGDFIEASGVAGTVEHIGMFSTVIKTGDNRVIIVPNGLIYSSTITNYSAEATRRIDMTIGISYDDDIPKAKSLIKGILDSDERVLAEPAPAIMVLELGASSVDIAVRPWVKREDYWATRGDLLERIKTTLEGAGLSIPYPQHDVHLFGQVAGNA